MITEFSFPFNTNQQILSKHRLISKHMINSGRERYYCVQESGDSVFVFVWNYFCWRSKKQSWLQ